MASDGTRRDIERRSHRFARAVRVCAVRRRWSCVQWSDLGHLLHSSGAVAAHFIEAGQRAHRPDSTRRLALAREQAAESMWWLEVLAETSPDHTPLAPLEQLHQQAETLNLRLRSILRRES
jgi:four helix bundle protein